jgi:hypothetical protein
MPACEIRFTHGRRRSVHKAALTFIPHFYATPRGPQGQTGRPSRNRDAHIIHDSDLSLQVEGS